MTDPSTTDETPLTLPRAQVEDVFQATEQVRAADFPTVPAELLAEVLTAERDNPDSRQTAARAVGRVIDTYLRDQPGQSLGDESGIETASVGGEIA